MKMRDVEPKHISGVGNLYLRDDFKDKVEYPCVAACLFLYDLNIRTTYTNGHQEDPTVQLNIDYDSLSDENKEIANNLINNQLVKLEGNTIVIIIPASLDDDADKISERLLDIVSVFQYQDVLSSHFKQDLEDYCQKKIIHYLDDYDQDFLDQLESCEFDPHIGIVKFSSSTLDNKIINKLNTEMGKRLAEDINPQLIDLDSNEIYANLELLNKHLAFCEGKKK